MQVKYGLNRATWGSSKSSWTPVSSSSYSFPDAVAREQAPGTTPGVLPLIKGLDENGNVANFVETEQILFYK